MGRAPKYCIILAGGKGTRMHSADRPKVCFPIDGRPAIVHAIDIYRQCGIVHPVVVVGAMSGQVIETVGRVHEDVIFAYQAEQLGTGHAARQGTQVLKSLGGEEEVLVVAGDRLVEPLILEHLFNVFYSRRCDLAFLAGPKRRRSDPGRVLLYPDGSVTGNVEVCDVWQRQALARLRELAELGDALSRQQVLDILQADFPDERKAALAYGTVGALWQTVTVEGRAPTPTELLAWIPLELTRFDFVDVVGQPLSLTPAQVDDAPLANFSVYLVKISALRYALARLTTANAQGEEYLSDIISLLAQARLDGSRRFRVQVVRVDTPNYVMAFNDPAELLEIEAYIQSKKRPRTVQEPAPGPAFRPIADWLTAFRRLQNAERSQDDPLWAELLALYGESESLLAERTQAYLDILIRAAQELGADTPVLLVRAPGRVNLMGRHVDHQGGHCNLMTIDREVLMAVHPRPDDQVRLYNLDAETFPPCEFAISELLTDLPWDDWLSLVSSERVHQMVLATGGDWSQYVKAAILRLQKKFPTLKLRGLDMIVQGNIPVAAGLSSSSAVVVATAEATVFANQLDVYPAQLVDLCGEGEWFVGTRGGSADHAAIKFGQKGQVVKVAFFDFVIEGKMSFPDNYRLIICDSQVKAPKSAAVQDTFNHRVACYHIGLALIKARYPQYAPLLHHLRDVNTRTLGIPLAWIYKLLLRLPEQATRAELEAMLPLAQLSPLFATHAPPSDGLYPIRGVVLYGLAECERSRIAADLLTAGRIAELGQLMAISHDGDRVCTHDEAWQPQPHLTRVSNDYLLDLIDDLESGDPERVLRAQIQYQSGSYRCSTPEIDRMVDVALHTEGVVGAQLAGAGLGGCMMVLARQAAVDQLIVRMTELCYRPRGLAPTMSISVPIAGSGVLLEGMGAEH
jgi:N-acetylgalactosamine kinase